jgi:hypothetical protein
MQPPQAHHKIGDILINLQYMANHPAGAPPCFEIQGEYFCELCKIFGQTQTVVIEPPGEFGTPE